jgi:hypothetical protein
VTLLDKCQRDPVRASEPANVRDVTMLQRDMASHTVPFADLSDDQLLAEVHRLASAERGATAALIRSLIALDARPHLYLRDGCSSLFVYCTRVLHLSESETYNRIEVARAARRFPIMLDALEDGSVTLTALRLLAPHLTEDNHQHVLAEARHTCKADVERLIARLRPQPDVPTVIRKLPEHRLAEGEPPVAPTSSRSDPPVDAGPARQAPSEPIEPVAPPRAIVAPLSPERYKLELTISADTREKLRRVQDLMRHALPNGDVAVILDRALSSLLDNLERRRCAMTPKPRRARDVAPGSRSIPAAVRREVWRRDERRCAFVGQQGRCTETAFLELHHVDPYAVGGEGTVDNIQLRCRAHNRYEAQLFFGSDLPTIVREQQPAWPA